jgi:hypothetical protein
MARKNRHSSFNQFKKVTTKTLPKPNLPTGFETAPIILSQDSSKPEPQNTEVLPKPKEKFNLPLLEVIFAIVLFGLQQGWAMSGFPPNIIAACVIWALMLALSVHAFWKWEKTAKFKFSTKLAITTLVVIVIVWGLWKPVLEAYRKEHSPQLNEPPTFTEGIEAIDFSTAGLTQHIDFSRIQTKRRFIIGNIPAYLYVEDGKPYADFDIYNKPNEPVVKLRHNKLLNRPDKWEMNADEKALEVVNEKGQPVFQLYYKSRSHIVFTGLFVSNVNVPVLTTETEAIARWNFENVPYPIKPIFKYPASQYSGQRR